MKNELVTLVGLKYEYNLLPAILDCYFTNNDYNENTFEESFKKYIQEYKKNIKLKNLTKIVIDGDTLDKFKELFTFEELTLENLEYCHYIAILDKELNSYLEEFITFIKTKYNELNI
jgi:hypothetical protein